MTFTSATDDVINNSPQVPVKRSYVAEFHNGFQLLENDPWLEVSIKKDGWSKRIVDANPVVGTARLDIGLDDCDEFLYLDEFSRINPVIGFSDIRIRCDVVTAIGIESEYIFRGKVKSSQIVNTKILIAASDYLEKMKSAAGDIDLVADTHTVQTSISLSHASNWDNIGTELTFEINRIVGNAWAFGHGNYVSGTRRSWVPQAFIIELDDGTGFSEVAASEYIIDTAMGLVRFASDQIGLYVGIRIREINVYIEGTLELADIIETIFRKPANCPLLGCGIPGTSIETNLSGTMTFTNGSYIINGIIGTDFHNELEEGSRISYGETDTNGNLIYGIVASVTPGLEQINLRYPYRGITAAGTSAFKSSLKEAGVSITNLIWFECDGTAADLFRTLQDNYADSVGYKVWWNYADNLVIGDRVRIKTESCADRELQPKKRLTISATTEDLASAVRSKGTVGHAKNLVTADPNVYVMPLAELEGSLNTPFEIGNLHWTQPYLNMTWQNYPSNWTVALTGTVTFNAGPAPYTATGVGTLFLSELKPGDCISIDFLGWGVVESIQSNFQLTFLYYPVNQNLTPIVLPAGPAAFVKAQSIPWMNLIDSSIESTYAVAINIPGCTNICDPIPYVLIDLQAEFDLSFIHVYNLDMKNANKWEQGITLYGSTQLAGPYIPITPETVDVPMKVNEAKEFDCENSLPIRYIKIFLTPFKFRSSDASDWPRFVGLRSIAIFGSQTICNTACIQGTTAPGAVTGKTGTITFNAGGPPYTVTGAGTQFTTELQEGSSIALDADPLNFGYVREIIDNFSLTILLPYAGIPGANGFFSEANNAFDPYFCVEGEGGHLIGGYSHEDSGLTTWSAVNAIQDAIKVWWVDEWKGFTLRILSGPLTGGQYKIISNNANQIFTTGMGNPGIGVIYVVQEKNFISDYNPVMIAKMWGFGHRMKFDDKDIVDSEMGLWDRVYLLLNEFQRLFRDIVYMGPFDPRNKIFDTVLIEDDYRKISPELLRILVQAIEESDSGIKVQGTEFGAGPYH